MHLVAAKRLAVQGTTAWGRPLRRRGSEPTSAPGVGVQRAWRRHGRGRRRRGRGGARLEGGQRRGRVVPAAAGGGEAVRAALGAEAGTGQRGVVVAEAVAMALGHHVHVRGGVEGLPGVADAQGAGRRGRGGGLSPPPLVALGVWRLERDHLQALHGAGRPLVAVRHLHAQAGVRGVLLTALRGAVQDAGGGGRAVQLELNAGVSGKPARQSQDTSVQLM